MNIDELIELIEDNGRLTSNSYTNLGFLIERKFTFPNACDYTMLLPDDLIDLKIEDSFMLNILDYLLEKVINGDEFSPIIAWAIGRSYLDQYNKKLMDYLISSDTRDSNLIVQCLRSAEVSNNNILMEYTDFLKSLGSDKLQKEIHSVVNGILDKNNKMKGQK